MAGYPDDYDASLWPTHHLPGVEVLERCQPPLYRHDPSDPTGGWRGGEVATLIEALTEALAESQRQLSGQRRINQMLSGQLRMAREQRQVQAQPPFRRRLPGIPVKD